MHVAQLIEQWCFENGHTFSMPFAYDYDIRSYIEIDSNIILRLRDNTVSYLSAANDHGQLERRIELGDVSNPEFFDKLSNLVDGLMEDL